MAARWLKGNTHTHTHDSDGDAPLAEVADWYASHGYDFLIITDHNRVTDVSAWQAAGRPLVLIPGCEVSLSSEGKPVHVSSLGSGTLPRVEAAATIRDTLERGVEAVRAAGGIPQVNHPNYNWAFTDAQMRDVPGWHLLEVLNASTDSNNFGGGGHPGVEEMWDRLLTAGRRIWAVASDDTHDVRGEFWGHRSPPGRAWVVVRAEEPTSDAILQAMERGEFYASTEVAIEQIESSPQGLALVIAEERDYGYTTHFIGAGGRTLAIVPGPRPVHRLRGDERYVRAKIHSSNGGVAWTQPAFAR